MANAAAGAVLQDIRVRSSTELGRQLEDCSGLLLPLVRRLLKHPLAKRWRPLTLLLLLLAGVVRQVGKKGKQQKAVLQREAILWAAPDKPKASEGSEEQAEKEKADKRKKVSFWSLLRTEDGRLSVGLPDYIAVLVTGVCSALAMVYKGLLLAALMRAQNMGDLATWRRVSLQYPVLCIAYGALTSAQQHYSSRFALRWREIVTTKLHSLYFSNLSYYRLMNGDAAAKLPDPDITICKDVQDVCSTYSRIVVRASTAMLTGFVLNRALLRPAALTKADGPSRRDWRWSLVAPGFMMVGLPILWCTFALTPLTWVYPFLVRAKSRYDQALTRVQLHGERICMLQGEQYELDILNLRTRAGAYWRRYGHLAELPQMTLLATLFSDEGISLISQVGLLTAATMVAHRLREPGGRAEVSIPEPDVVHKDVATDHGAAIQDNWTTMYSIGQMGLLLEAVTSKAMVDANAQKVMELYAFLSEIEEELQQTNSKFADRGPLISFDDVTIQTPIGQTLLQGLSFEVNTGDMLLISGHNGAGKSSIIRCLCNLWPIPSGLIVRPGGAVHAEEDVSLHEKVYYLPQKPVTVLGSLADQLTYPLRLPGGLPEAELRRWLRYVHLEYLADRVLLRDDCNWEEILSLGEQQALSIARLFYHRPRFAILDECTSAISRGLERRLFEMAEELGMACITICHRPALQEHHTRALRLTGTLEQDKKGWILEDLPRSATLPDRRPICADAAEAHARIETYLSRCGETGAVLGPGSALQRAAQSSTPLDLETLVRQRWPSSFRRFLGVMRLGMQGPGMGRYLARELTVACALLWLRCWMTWDIWASLASAICSGLTGDLTGLAATVITNAIMSPLLGWMNGHLFWQIRTLSIELWFNAKCYLQARALKSGAFLKVRHPSDPRVPAVENPVQQIADVRLMFESMENSLGNVISSSTLGLYSLRTLVRGGGFRTLAILSGSFAIFGFCQRQAPDWKDITKKTLDRETRLQVLHTRLRHVAEPVAFSGGGAAERSIIEKRFQEVCDFRRKAFDAEFVHSWMMAVFSSYDLLPMWVQRLLALNFAAKNIPNVEQGTSPAVIAANFLYDRSIQFTQTAQMNLVTFIPDWYRLDGRFMRILELVVAFDAADVVSQESAIHKEQTVADNNIVVEHLDLVAPNGSCLAEGVSFKLQQGQPLLVTGPNASGKSLLGCVLLGLLPARGKEPKILLPELGAMGDSTRAPLEILMAVPQRIYLPLGTLGDQVCYPQQYLPEESSSADEDRMLQALRAAGIESILKREPNTWQAERVWEDILSGGEQQRMGLARLFYRKPRFALLDECTSMVASSAEEGLYQTIFHDYGITPLTLTQRLFMPELYPFELRLGHGGSAQRWALLSTETRHVQTEA